MTDEMTTQHVTSWIGEATHFAIRLQNERVTSMFPKMAPSQLQQHTHASSQSPPHAHGQVAHAPHGHAELAHAPSSRAERVATWLSFACAVHCLVMPLAVGALPLLGASGSMYLGETAEFGMTSLVVTSALAAVIWGYRRHRDARFVVATGLGLAIYLIGHAIGHESTASWYGIALAVVGGLTLAGSSFFSARLSHACADPSCPT
jgi:MerC mercury resistance protein